MTEFLITEMLTDGLIPSQRHHTPNGVWPVMLTPFSDDKSIDYDALAALVQWYIQRGCAGLFANCLSSEMYELTEEERLELSAAVVKYAAGKLPVIASGTFGGTINEQSKFIKRMHQTGVNAVVVLTNQLVPEQAGEKEWLEQADLLLKETEGIPLGLYECPVPHKRLISPDAISWAASTGRFHFMKETSCSLETITGKIAAAGSSNLAIFNANAPAFLKSLRRGAAGFSGLAANFFPQLYAWLYENHEQDRERAEKLQRWLSVADMTVRHKYPFSAKLYLSRLGLPLTTACRVSQSALTEEELLVLDALRESAADVEAGLAK